VKPFYNKIFIHNSVFLIYLVRKVILYFQSCKKNSYNMNTLKPIKYFLVFIFLFTVSFANATTYYGKNSSAPNVLTNWGTTSGGGGTNPGNFTTAGDIFIIENGTTMTASAAWLIGAAGTTASTLQIDYGGTLAMSTYLLTLASCDFTNSGTFSGSGGVTISGTLVTNSIDGFTTTGTLSMTKTGGTATFNGNVGGAGLTINGTDGTLNLGTGLSHTFTSTWTRTAGTLDGGSSTINFSKAGTVFSGTGGTFTANTSTVGFTNAAAQTFPALTYNNLTLAGGGVKTVATTPRVNGVLSMEGTAMVTVTTGVVTYGGNATLQYNTSTARTASSEEWITPFAATGGIIIANTGEITLNAAKVFNASIPLTINNGAKLNTSASNYQLTFGGNFINNGGTFTANASPIVITNTMVTQSIAGFTTTGNVTFSKTSGTATISDNVSAANLTINGTGGKLILSGSNTFSGTRTLTAGTLVLSNAAALGSSGTSLSLNGGTLDLMTDASVNAYNITVGGTSTISSDRLTSGSGITHTLGTLSIGNFQLNITVGSNVSSGNAGLTFGATTISASTPKFDVASGINLTLGALSGNFAFTKQNSGQLTLNDASARTSGTVTLTAGTIQLGSASALGTTGVTLALNGGTLDLEIDASVNAYNTTVGGTATIASGRTTSGAGITHTLGTLSIGNFQLNLTVGSNVSSGTAGLTFGNTTFSASTPKFDVATDANLTLGALSGNRNFTKQNSGQLTLNSASTRSSGVTTLTAGTMVLGSASALGTTGTTLTLNGGTLDLAISTSVNAYNTTVSGTTTIVSDLASSGAGITHTLGTLSIGNFQLNLLVGSNVSRGTAGLKFGTTTLSSSTPVFDVASGANLTMGAIGGAYAMTKQGDGMMTLATTSTRSTIAGTTTLNAGTLRLNIANALNTSATTPLYLNGGKLSLGVTAGATYGGTATIVGGIATIESDRLTSGGGVTQTLGTLSIGNYSLYITAGSNVTSGTAGITFGTTTLTASTPIFDITSSANLILGALGGNFDFIKQNTGRITLNTAANANRTSATVTLSDGTMVIGSVSALGTAGVPLSLNGGTLDLRTNSTVNAHNITVGGTATIASGRAALGAGITHILGNLSIGANTLSINQGSNVSSGTAAIQFGNLTLTDAPTFSPGTANMLISGTASGNFKFTKSGAGTLQKTSTGWALANDFEITAGTYNAINQTTTVSGLTTVSGGTYTAGTANQTFNGGLTISGGVYTGSTGNLIATDVTMNSGTLTAPSTVSYISGNWINNGATFAHNGGIVNFYGTSMQTIGGNTAPTFNILTITNTSAAITAEVNVTTTTLNNISGGTLDMAGYTLAGTTINNTNSKIKFNGASNGLAIGTGTIEYYGTTQDVKNGTYADLIISSAGTKIAVGAITTISLDNGGSSDETAIFDIAGNTLTAGTIDNTGATIKFSGATNGLAIPTGTVEYYGTGQTVTSGTYMTLNLTAASTYTAGSAITATTLNNISGGTLDMVGNTLTGTTINNTGSTIKFSGATNGLAIPTGTVEYYGTGQTVTDGTYYNLTINQSSGTATLGGTSALSTVTSNLDINTGSLTVPSTNSLTVRGTTTLNTAECLIIKTEGSFIDNGITINGSGSARVEKELTADRWWYIGSPLSNSITALSAFGSLSGTTGVGRRLAYFDEANHAYTYLADDYVMNSPLRGYLYKDNTDFELTTVAYSGSLNTGETEATNLTRQTSGTFLGFNLISNPYPSAINLGSNADPTPGLTMTNLGTTFWFYNNGTYKTYNWQSGYGIGTTQYVPAMQSFWVRVADGFTSGTFSLDNRTRCHNSQTFYKTGAETNAFRIQLQNDSVNDEAMVTFFADASSDFDPFDSEKMFSENNDNPQIYTVTDDNTVVAINGQPEITEGTDRIVPLGFKTNIAGIFTLQATNISEFDPNITVYLEDTYLNHFQELNSTDSYTFTSGAVDDVSRFKLHFGYDLTEIASVNANVASLYVFENTIYVNAPNESEMIIYNTLGEKISQQQVESGLNKIPSNLSDGIYIVKILTDSDILTKKILIVK
jgi:hypothetical protein